jgi:single-stranded-DNA-specific exonuclease
MADARLCIELLTESDFVKAMTIADELEKHNRERQRTQNATAEQVRERLRSEFSPDRDKAIVLEGDWHEGVLGIVAGRIAEEYVRPTIIIALRGEMAKASGRSIGTINLYEALKKCENLLESFGGHAQAAGLALPAANIARFRTDFNRIISEAASAEDFTPRIEIDAEVALSDLAGPVVQELNLLEPFGEANPKPVLASCGLRLAGKPRRMGRDARHLSFYVTDGAKSLRAVIFDTPELIRLIESAPASVDLAYTADINTWNNKNDVELIVKDVRIP